MKILVVDDSEANRQSAMETLIDHDVTTTSSLESGIKLLQSLHPLDMVLTDMMMPLTDFTGLRGSFDPKSEVPCGFIMALKATMRPYQVKYVAMVTDLDHHHDMMSRVLGYINPPTFGNHHFNIDGARVIFTEAPLLEDGRKDWLEVFMKVTAPW